MRIVLKREPGFEDLTNTVPLEEGTPTEKQINAVTALLNQLVPDGDYSPRYVENVLRQTDPDPKLKNGTWILAQWRKHMQHKLAQKKSGDDQPYGWIFTGEPYENGLDLFKRAVINDTNEALETFMQAKQAGALKGGEGAIEHYKHLGDLQARLDNLEPEDFLSARQKKRGVGAAYEKVPGVKKLSEVGPFSVYEVTSVMACRFFGRDTEWCTSDPRAAADYLAQGPLYVVTSKVAGKAPADGGGTKDVVQQEKPVAQWHEDGSFMDQYDEPITELSKLPQEFVDVILAAEAADPDIPIPPILTYYNDIKERGWQIQTHPDGYAVVTPEELDASNGLPQRAAGEVFKNEFDNNTVDLSVSRHGYYGRSSPPKIGIVLQDLDPVTWQEMLKILDQLRTKGYWDKADERLWELQTEWQDAAYPAMHDEFMGEVNSELQEWLEDGTISTEEWKYHTDALEDGNLDTHELFRNVFENANYEVDWEYDNDGAYLDVRQLVTEYLYPEDLRRLDGYNQAVALRQQQGGAGQLLHKGALPQESMEGKGELTPEQEKAIIEFVKTHPNLDDSDFHAFAQSIGADPHEAEEVVYRYVQQREAVYKSRAVEMGVDLCLQNAVPFDKAVEAISTCPQPKDDDK